MNPILIIKNIGPIRKAELEFKKVNILNGPQGSGKSTIAKLISFCYWLEKTLSIKLDKKDINKAFLYDNLVLYHNMESYFNEDSYLYYKSDRLEFELNNLEITKISFANNINEIQNFKVAYIPYERNIISIPHISTLEMENNYIRDFIFEWLSSSKQFDISHSIKILNLKVRYHHDSTHGDLVSLNNGKSIKLSEASSGFQSVIPLLVNEKYVTDIIYRNSKISYDKKEDILSKMINLIEDMRKEGTTINFPTNISSTKNYSEYLLSKFFTYHSSKVVIEEPEMNIFPETQYELIKKIISLLDFKRGDSITISTHSPFIMTSLNNLIEAGMVYKNGKEAVSMIIPKKSILDYKDVSAWELSNNGIVKSILDKDTHLISARSIDSAYGKIESDFNKLLEYER